MIISASHFRPARGFGLLETMLTIALMAVLLMIMIHFFNRTLYLQQSHNKRLQLQGEIHRVLNLMAKDIARSGYAAYEQVLVSNAGLMTDSRSPAGIITAANRAPANSCFLFWYDLDQSGCVGTRHDNICQKEGRNRTLEIQTELLGYRLNSKMVETRIMYKRGTPQDCKGTACQIFLSEKGCDTKGWGDLMDSSVYEITTLQFEWLVKNKALQVMLRGRFKEKAWRHIDYESAVVITLQNQWL
ncbi:hypothetical protein [Spirabiliibacterium falconis]|uniref:hypothetical protein n=1 Tax=Spirabiliibacterium falconis TaxID=572023 RepID=UPI001AAD7A3A|nr:hypothetical protein [Spirabiliibacterium falconis]MBE2893845.1 hypothetical protein [Spirabiliibacterium falconis]